MQRRRLVVIPFSAIPGWLARLAPGWLLGAALLAASPALAISFSAPMNGLQEVGPNASTATGLASITVVGDLLSLDVTWTGLTALPSAAHIHCCTDPGTNVGVAIGFPGFPAATSGNYLQDFDLLDPSIYTASFLANFGGGTAAGGRAALLAGLEAGRAYVNIHNAVFPGGEIRGNVVPEPSEFTLLAVALIAIAAGRRGCAG